MDDSMGEDDSLISSTSWYPGQSNGSRPIPPSFSRADSSFSYPVRQATSAQPRQLLDFDDPRFADEELEPEEEEEEERGADGADEADEADEAEDDAEGSETSSAMFDAEADPEGFAKRLDELAGVLEKSEEEVRALKWGPPIGKGVKGVFSGLIHELTVSHVDACVGARRLSSSDRLSSQHDRLEVRVERAHTRTRARWADIAVAGAGGCGGGGSSGPCHDTRFERGRGAQPTHWSDG